MTKAERAALKAWLQQASLEFAGAQHDEGARRNLSRLFGALDWFVTDGRTEADAAQLAESVIRRDAPTEPPCDLSRFYDGWDAFVRGVAPFLGYIEDERAGYRAAAAVRESDASPPATSDRDPRCRVMWERHRDARDGRVALRAKLTLLEGGSK